MSELKFINSNRGKSAVIYEMFFYTERSILKNETVIFMCPKKNCYASIQIDEDRTMVLEIRGEHTHRQLMDCEVEKYEIKNCIKRKITEELSTTSNEIILEAISEADYVTENDIFNYKKNIYRKRRKLLPVLPKSHDEAILQLTSWQETLFTSKNEKFIYINNNKIVSFTCETNLKTLCDNPEFILADGTYGYCPRYFYQLYTIHIYKNGLYLPLAYYFLTGNTTNGYIEMWQSLINLCNSMNLVFDPKSIRVDFEKNVHLSIQHCFPQCQIYGCRFHLEQDWHRKLNQDFPSLRNVYKPNTEVGKWIHYFFGLSFISPEEVPDAFCELIEIAPNCDVLVYSDYIYENYIQENCLFPPEMWAETPSTLPIITNRPGSFYSQYYEQIDTTYPSMWKVIETLKEIQSETYVQIEDISSGIHHLQPAAERQKLEHIQKHWLKYATGEIDRCHFVQIMGLNNLPSIGV